MNKIILIAFVFLFTSCKEKKYWVHWVEKDDSWTQGHTRYNGVWTGEGYLFTDTVWNFELKRKNVVTTLIKIHEEP